MHLPAGDRAGDDQQQALDALGVHRLIEHPQVGVRVDEPLGQQAA